MFLVHINRKMFALIWSLILKYIILVSIFCNKLHVSYVVPSKYFHYGLHTVYFRKIMGKMRRFKIGDKKWIFLNSQSLKACLTHQLITINSSYFFFMIINSSYLSVSSLKLKPFFHVSNVKTDKGHPLKGASIYNLSMGDATHWSKILRQIIF